MCISQGRIITRKKERNRLKQSHVRLKGEEKHAKYNKQDEEGGIIEAHKHSFIDEYRPLQDEKTYCGEKRNGAQTTTVS